jgi:hypothetical protein
MLLANLKTIESLQFIDSKCLASDEEVPSSRPLALLTKNVTCLGWGTQKGNLENWPG